MKRKNVLMSLVLVSAMFALVLSGCKKEPTTFTLSALVAGAIDLNGATTSNIVPVKPVIVATFNTDVDVATAIPANVTLIQDYDNAAIAVTVTASGSTITITPTADLGSGTLYKLTLLAGLKSTGGISLTLTPRSFTTLGTFVPAGVIAFWNFEGNANDVAGSYNPAATGIVNIVYSASRNTAAGTAATFDGTTSIIEIPNGDQLMNTKDFTLSFWVKAEDSGKGHFIIGLAAYKGFQFELNSGFTEFKLPMTFELSDGKSIAGDDLKYSGNGKTKDNGGVKWTTFNKEDASLPSVLKNKWFHITYVFKSVTKERMIFLNGELVVKQDFNLCIDDQGKPYSEAGIIGLKYGGGYYNDGLMETVNDLAFGFVQSRAGKMWATESWGGYSFPGANHFKGQLDDVRIFHKPLSETEIRLMYNSEK